MKSLVKPLSIMCLIMGILCSAAIAVGRLDQSPTRLQLLGIDICDGQPCYRGIKVGADWAKTLKMFPEGIMNQNDFNDQLDPVTQLAFGPSADNQTVDVISIS